MANKKRDKQFIIGIFILTAWVLFMLIPVFLICQVSLDDPHLKDKHAVILNTAAGISALFSTALGFILGHYYGKQGFENAQERADQAIQGKIKAEVKAEAKAVETADLASDKYEKILVQEITKIKGEYLNQITKIKDDIIKLVQ